MKAIKTLDVGKAEDRTIVSVQFEYTMNVRKVRISLIRREG